MGISIGRYPGLRSFDQHLGDYLAQMDINVVLDVGAYIGNYAKGLRDVGYRGQIISFEPVPASYEKLCAAMRDDPLWVGKPFGLSDENGEAVINTHGSGDFNSLLPLSADAERAYALDPSLRGQTSIQLKRLDSVLPGLVEAIQSPRIFLKIDTQGHDLAALKGASGVLGMVLGLQSELPAVEIYEGMPSMPSILSYYASCGFVPIGFYPVNTFRKIQISPEFDVLFTRFDGKLHRP